MTLNTGLFDLCQGVTLRDGVVAFDTFYPIDHHIRVGLLFAERLSPNKLSLNFVTVRTFRCRLMMTAQALHSGFEELSMLLSRGMADVAIQYSGDMFPVGKRMTEDLNLYFFIPFVAFAALRMGHLRGLWQGDRSFRVAGRARRFLPFVTFETGLFRGSKGRWIMGVVIDIVMAGGAGVFQFFDMETVWNGDIVRVKVGRSLIDIKNTLMAADTVRIDLVQFGGKTRMFPLARQGKDIDARHQGMTCRMTLGAVDFGMQGGLFPKRGLLLLMMMTGDTEFLLGRGIGGKRDGGIKDQDCQNST